MDLYVPLFNRYVSVYVINNHNNIASTEVV